MFRFRFAIMCISVVWGGSIMPSVDRSERFWLVCTGCGAEYEPGPHWYGCDKCRDNAGHPHWLEVRYDWDRVDVRCLQRAGRLWEYGPLLPIRDLDQLPTLGEGNTPLL